MFNHKISIHHKIDETSKEIYEFERTSSNTWDYVGIYFSHRNDEDDVWGDEWGKFYEDLKILEKDRIAESFGYSGHSEMLDGFDYYSYEYDKLREIDTKYNPICQKTKHGKTYYSGMSWGCNTKDKDRSKYIPKISKEEIKEEILRQTSKIKINL